MRLLAAAVVAATVVGCSFLVKTDDLVSGEPTDGGGGGAERPPTCQDTTRDPTNCGVCGRSCLFSECVSSRCLPRDVATDQGKVLGIGVFGDLVFWVSQDPPSLRRAFKDGVGQLTLSGPGDLVQRDVFDIAADSDYVYWTEVSANQVFRKPMSGVGTRETTGVTGPGQAAFLVVDGAQIYVSDYDFLRMRGTIVDRKQALYPESDVVAGLAVHSNFLFWARQTARKIVSGPVTGGGKSEVATTGGRVMGIAVDRDFIYWVEDSIRVKRMSRRGGTTPLTLYEATRPFGDSDIAVDETSVYWTQQNDGLVLRLAK